MTMANSLVGFGKKVISLKTLPTVLILGHWYQSLGIMLVEEGTNVRIYVYKHMCVYVRVQCNNEFVKY